MPDPIALEEIRSLAAANGLYDTKRAVKLANAATNGIDDAARAKLQPKIVELLQSIEIESILGGPINKYRGQLHAILDWIEKSAPSEAKLG